mmetsp:Transcript_62906/g.182488  ORF Transcript_62906/g.182488 Transcript_62906/m.182488 type:complete len:113 (+) Transcript_62906:334-672(+)
MSSTSLTMSNSTSSKPWTRTAATRSDWASWSTASGGSRGEAKRSDIVHIFYTLQEVQAAVMGLEGRMRGLRQEVIRGEEQQVCRPEPVPEGAIGQAQRLCPGAREIWYNCRV